MKKLLITSVLIVLFLSFSACDSNTHVALTITFKAEGSADIIKSVEYGGTLMDVPEIPNKEGHLAVWSVTDFTNITSNLSVNAIYTADLMTVTFKMNGQSDIVAIRVVPYGGTLTDIPVAPYKEGYTGIWDKDFSNITSHITVTGRYQINQYTVSFDTNGGDPFDSITQDYGTLITAKPNKNGSTFMGWYDVSTTFKYTNVPGHDITLYAMWFDDNNIIIVT